MTAPKKAPEMPFPIAAMWAVIGAGILVALGVFVVPALWVQFTYRPAEGVVMDRRWAERQGTKAKYHVVEGLLAYQADGQEYQAWVELPFESLWETGPEAKAALPQVPVGRHMTCYHDPLHPEVATANRDRWHWGYLLGLTFGGVCLFAGVVLMAASWRRTFPRGVGPETVDLLRRLPWRFWLAAAGALLCAGVGFVAVRNMGPALAEWTCLLLLAAAGGLVLSLRWVARYGAVALPSAEKRAAAASPEAPTAPAESARPAGWNRAEPVAVERGVRLPVRLPHTLAGGGCVSVGCGAYFLFLVFLVVLVQRLSQTWKEPIPTGTYPLLVLTVAAVGSVLLIAVGRRAWRRVSKLTVEVSAHPLRAGDHYKLSLSHPDPATLAGLQMELACEEHGGRGKGSKEATPVRQPIALEPPSGRGDVRTGWLEVPPGAPMSFALEHHNVRWSLKVRLGGFPRWGGDCPVMVAPGGARDQSASDHPLRLEEEALSLWIDGDRSLFRVGETLSGGYAVRSQEAADALRTVELSVLWHTGAAGAGDLSVCHYEEHAAVDGDDLALYAPRRYHVRLPDGPPSYDGKVVQVRWVVRLRLRYVSGAEVVRELPFRFVPTGAAE